MIFVNVFHSQGVYRSNCQRMRRIGEIGQEEILFCLPTNGSGAAKHEYDCEDAAALSMLAGERG
jgi:hypothetical protein